MKKEDLSTPIFYLYLKGVRLIEKFGFEHVTLVNNVSDKC